MPKSYFTEIIISTHGITSLYIYIYWLLLNEVLCHSPESSFAAVFYILLRIMCMKIILSKLLTHLPRANQAKQGDTMAEWWYQAERDFVSFTLGIHFFALDFADKLISSTLSLGNVLWGKELKIYLHFLSFRSTEVMICLCWVASGLATNDGVTQWAKTSAPIGLTQFVWEIPWALLLTLLNWD